MKLSKKEQELLAAAGVTLKDEDFVEKPTIENEESTKEMANWQAQSLLINLRWPYPEMVAIECWGCKRKFLTNYKANVYCSMQCFKDELEKIGIAWRPEKSFAQRWGNLEPPLMIPPEAIRAMRRLLSIVDQESLAVSHSPEPDYEPEPDIPEISEDVLPDPPNPSNDPDIQEEHETNSDDDFLAILDALDD